MAARQVADVTPIHRNPMGPTGTRDSYESGRTVIRRLKKPEAAICKQGIENCRRLSQIIGEMEAVGEGSGVCPGKEL